MPTHMPTHIPTKDDLSRQDGGGAEGINLEGVKKSFGNVRALTGIDLEIPQGVFLSVFGPNGAGKTTLIRIIAAIAKPTSGVVSVAGHNPSKSPHEVRSVIGVISHDPYLYENLTALENLLFFGRMYGVEEYEKRALSLIKYVGLATRLHDTVRTFSRGMKQRLAVARALVHSPSVLLLDEPYTGLDQNGAEIFTHMLEEQKNKGRTIVLTTHNVEEGLGLSDRVLIMNSGRIVFQGDSGAMSSQQFKEIYKDKVGNLQTGFASK